jgi:hypothetical protein
MNNNFKTGIVCLIDAIGAKNYDNSQIEHFMTSRKVILDNLNNKVLHQAEVREIADPHISIFNDTIIISIECNNDEYNVIKALGVATRKLIIDGIDHGILYRGAIGYGEYLINKDENTVIGSATTDAASWYESIEMIGIIMTPRCYMKFLADYIKDDKKPDQYYLKYNTETKNGKLESFCVNWPKVLFVESIKPNECIKDNEKAYLLNKLSSIKVPIGTEKKYYNSLEYYNHALEFNYK